MLLAGTLGTVIGDGLGHAFASVEVGVPVSAISASVCLAVCLYLWKRKMPASDVSYWLVVVMVRWWGTNVGDIMAFLLNLLVSLAISAAILFTLIFVWKAKTPEVGSRGAAETWR